MKTEARTKRIRFLIDLATEALCRAGPEFSPWLKHVNFDARVREEPVPTATELHWAWNAMRSDRELNAVFGYLEAPPAWLRARAKSEDVANIVEVLPAGAVCSIDLKERSDSPEWRARYLEWAAPQPFAQVRIDEPLCMERARLGMFRCCPTPCTLRTPALELGVPAEASAVFGVPESDITLHKGEVFVPCKSLNHAYVLASKRFERNRPAHGGRIYGNMSVVTRSGTWVSLEMVRLAAGGKELPYVLRDKQGNPVSWFNASDDSWPDP